ncbi:response regulator [Massilia sp. PAMC28688]|uniref:response regulator n=1 Tax=Massilia sp. PAMC28688 TaxID=2861283 RepID=UPI001C629E57|nr:response regulator [Massilia sp. PAMC28688]QYF92650.1 response regulator [Massilia sp. PAMC28688]
MQQTQVLIVDDEPANLLALEVMLAPLGCRVVRANSGREALRHLLHSEFAVVLMDLQMPTMDGMEVAELIRERRRSRSLPIIFVTASDPREFPIEKAYAVGAVDYLSKPINPIILVSKVRFFVELHVKNRQIEEMQQALHAAQIKASNERTRLILENAKEYAFIEMTPEGLVTDWSGAAARITGWEAGEICGQDIALLFSEEDRAAGQPALERAMALATGRAPDRRWHQRQDGKRFYADGVTIAVRDDAGAAQSLVKIFSDATARMLGEIERERLLKESEVLSSRLQSIFHQAPAFMCTLQGPDHVFEMANERYYQLIGKSAAILGRPVREVLPEVASQGFIALLDNVFRTGQSYVGNSVPVSVRQSDGRFDERLLDFVYVALRNTDGEISGIMVHGIDITERKRYEEAARLSDERYRQLIASMDEGYCLIEILYDANDQAADYRFIEVNPVFSKQTGLGQDAVGKTIYELVPELDHGWVERYARVAESGEAIRFVEEARAMGRWFDVYATRLGEPGSRIVALLFSDITARRKADEDLRRLAAELSEASRRKSEFLAVLAHELRNPLAPIRSGLEVIRLSAENPATVLRVSDMMRRQVSHMVHLIDDLLDVARITSGKIELKKDTVRLQDVLTTAIEASMPLMTSSRHRLQASLPEEDLLIYADPVRIAQVAGNLLTNAAKYTPEGGEIAISARRDGDAVCITVTDNGVGIPEEALPSVFDMFSQVSRNLGRAQGGLGIGLSIVRQLAELHGGRVQARSAGKDLGTAFEITLPLAAGAAAAPAPTQGCADEGPGHCFEILVADDNIDAADILATLLELRGHSVTVVHDGHAALTRAIAQRPDIAFLDIGMPGLTGLEVAREMRGVPALADVRLVALTGWGSEEDRARTREAGFDHHLTKPTQLSAVDDILRLAAAALPAGATSH